MISVIVKKSSLNKSFSRQVDTHFLVRASRREDVDFCKSAMAARGRSHVNRGSNKPTPIISTDNPIMPVFLAASKKLTERQDRHERLVKLSRDITIESKRIIFLLHSAITKEKSKEDLIAEAKERLQKVVNGPIKAIALELEHVPTHLHSKAITAGIQEFIEARTLCSILENQKLITYEEVQKELEFTITEDEKTRTVNLYFPQLDYMLGISDLSGEIMRNAINSVSSGNVSECLFACQVLRQLYAGFLGLNWPGPQLTHKLAITRNNVLKVEQAVYGLVLRDREDKSPKTKLSAPDNDKDEGIY